MSERDNNNLTQTASTAMSCEARIAADPEDGGRQLLPIWAKQIETARHQSEQAIVALSTRFSAIVERIDSALGTTTNKIGRQDAHSATQRNESELEAVLSALTAIQQSRSYLANEIRSITAYTAELSDLAKESRAESAVIKDEVCGSLVELQFQDRVSQILSQVVSSMERLCEEANDSGSVGISSERARQHAEEMMSHYTSEEQRRNHRDLVPDAVAPQAVTFF
jgi:hypothetical protein